MRPSPGIRPACLARQAGGGTGRRPSGAAGCVRTRAARDRRKISRKISCPAGGGLPRLAGMSIGGPNDALREEVPTLNNSVLLAQAAVQRCAGSTAVILQGTGLPVGTPVPANASGAFARPRPKRFDQTKISTQQV